MKTCPKCGTMKPLAMFYRDSRRRHGVSSWCKKCKDKSRVLWRCTLAGKASIKKHNESESHKRSVTKYFSRPEVRQHRIQTAEKYRADGRMGIWRALHREKLRIASLLGNLKTGKLRRNAHAVLQRAVKAGIIMKPKSCSLCKKPHEYIHGHHLIYEFPLSVLWVCPSCHRNIHLKEKQ